ncbi:MAG: hypothetical protein ACTSQ8_17370 [Candidatus Helarchaeota archaeon]
MSVYYTCPHCKTILIDYGNFKSCSTCGTIYENDDDDMVVDGLTEEELSELDRIYNENKEEPEPRAEKSSLEEKFSVWAFSEEGLKYCEEEVARYDKLANDESDASKKATYVEIKRIFEKRRVL